MKLNKHRMYFAIQAPQSNAMASYHHKRKGTLVARYRFPFESDSALPATQQITCFKCTLRSITHHDTNVTIYHFHFRQKMFHKKFIGHIKKIYVHCSAIYI